MKEMIEQRRKRAKAIKEYGTLRKAVEAGALEQFQDVSLSEAVVLGLVNQEVRTFVGIFGHGMTDVGEALRIYEEEDVIKTYNLILLPCSVGNTIRCQQYLHRLDQEECRRPQDPLFHWQMD